jgi:hypothetical protein
MFENVKLATTVPVVATGATTTLLPTGVLFTVKLELPVTVPKLALMVVLPATMADADPDELIVAMAALLDIQLAVLDKSCVLPSLYCPVAVNC